MKWVCKTLRFSEFDGNSILYNPLMHFMWGQSLYPALLMFNTLVAQKQVSHAQVGESWIPLFPVLVLF